MSYCPIDEAFGNYLTDVNPDPLETSVYKKIDGRNCRTRQKLKKKKINCNRKNTSFSMNSEDLYSSSPDVSEDDEDFNQNLQNYNPLTNIDLYNINAQNPIKKCKKKKRRSAKNTILDELSNDLYSGNYTQAANPQRGVVEGFENYNTVQPEKRYNIKKSNKNTRVRRPAVNEVFEYNEDDNKPINNLGYVHGDNDTDSEVEETKPILRAKHSNKSTKPPSELNNQISEINNKINFIMNQISTKDEEESNTYNNINDIILFVIFGVFVLIVIEGLYRLISKIIRANSILDLRRDIPPQSKIPRSVGSGEKVGGGESVVSSRDPIEMFTEYLRKK